MLHGCVTNTELQLSLTFSTLYLDFWKPGLPSLLPVLAEDQLYRSPGPVTSVPGGCRPCVGEGGRPPHLVSETPASACCFTFPSRKSDTEMCLLEESWCLFSFPLSFQFVLLERFAAAMLDEG